MRVRKKSTGRTARRVLAAMIVDEAVVRRRAEKWEEPGLFKAPYGNLLGGWAVEHVRKYGKALGRDVEGMYEEWKEGREDGDEMTEIVFDFLKELSDEYEREKEERKSDWLVDLAEKYFNEVRFEQAAEKVQGLVEEGKVEKAKGVWEDTKPLVLKEEEAVKLEEDEKIWEEAVRGVRAKPLFELPPGMGEYEKAMQRGAFVGIMASDKTGKSMWLLDMAVRGLEAGRRVAYFECGDLGRVDVVVRLAQRLTGRPRWKEDEEVGYWSAREEG